MSDTRQTVASTIHNVGMALIIAGQVSAALEFVLCASCFVCCSGFPLCTNEKGRDILA
jgi:hypothetical protein